MKTYYSLFALLAVCGFAQAEATTNAWGPETNNVKMSIMVKAASEVFSMEDINFSALIERLIQQTDPVSSFLWKSLSRDGQNLLKDYRPSSPSAKSAEELVLEMLNKLVTEGGIYSPDRFNGILLRGETKAMLQGMPAGPGHLSRLLLEDAFPSELSRTIKGGSQTIRVSDEVVLTIQYTNTSSNQTFYLLTIGAYSFDVLFPSEKRISVKEDHSHDLRFQSFALGPSGFHVFTVRVSGLCKFDEIGPYTIIARHGVECPDDNHKGFYVFSNPLTIKIVPDK